MNSFRPFFASTAILSAVLAPVLIGTGLTLLSSFGYFPSIGAYRIDLARWSWIFEQPGIYHSILISISSAFLSVFFALAIALVASYFYFDKGRSLWRWSSILALIGTPYLAVAVGLGFMLAPSGWAARIVASLIGLESPLDFTTVNDPWAMALTLGLLIKELPFLVLVTVGAASGVLVKESIRTGNTLGYAPVETWIKVILPQLYRRIRMPIFFAYIYALSNVEMAQLLGPSNPPTLAVYAARLFRSPDIEMIMPACGIAILIAVIAFLTYLIWRLVENMIGTIYVSIISFGQRNQIPKITALLAHHILNFVVIFGVVCLFLNLIWAVSWRWPFPSIFPQSFSLRLWERVGTSLIEITFHTLSIALITAVLSILVSIIWFETASKSRLSRFESLLFLPLLFPQIVFLFGLDQILYLSGFKIDFLRVVCAHFVLTFPYIIFILSAPWKEFDPRIEYAGLMLGRSPIEVLVFVKIPMLLAPILIAFAVGVAISVSLYLPTLFAGRGRIDTLTTETLTLASGSDRRLTSIFAILQTTIPLAALIFSTYLPRVIFRNRSGVLQEKTK